MYCKHCKKELVNTPGKRKKEFCNNTCRSNFWQKENRRNKGGVGIKLAEEDTKTLKQEIKPTGKEPKEGSMAYFLKHGGN